MSQTPASGTSAYAAPNDWAVRADIRSLCQWASDTDTPLTPTAFLASTVATTLLAEASGWIEAAALVGARYRIDPTSTPPVQDLLAILQAGTNASAMLTGLTVAVANYLMWLRRPARFTKAAMPVQTEMAFETLKKLEDGILVFGTVEGQAASVVNDMVETPQNVNQRYLSEVIARPYFGLRGNLIWRPGGR